jgi:hypothetical protein
MHLITAEEDGDVVERKNHSVRTQNRLRGRSGEGVGAAALGRSKCHGAATGARR